MNAITHPQPLGAPVDLVDLAGLSRHAGSLGATPPEPVIEVPAIGDWGVLLHGRWSWHGDVHALLAGLADVDGAEPLAATAYDGALVAGLASLRPGAPMAGEVRDLLALRSTPVASWVGRLEDLCLARDPATEAVRARFHLEGSSGDPIHLDDVALFAEHLYLEGSRDA